MPITGEWQKLSGGVEVKFGKRDWTTPCLVTFSGRDQLLSTILKIESNTVTLTDAAPLGAKEGIMQHTDSGPLQAAFDRAVAEGRNNVFDQCTTPVGEGAAGVWDAAFKGGNVFGDQAEPSLGETGKDR